MTKARRLRHTARWHKGSHRRGRTMAFEALDVRAVLSSGSVVAGPWMPPMEQFDGRDAQQNFTMHDASRPVSYDAIGDLGGGEFGSTTRLGPGADRFGGLPRDFGPPPLEYHAPMIVSSSGPLGGSTLLVLPPGGWDSMSPRDVVATLLLIDLLGQPTSAPPPPGSSYLSNSAKAPPPSNLGGPLPSALSSSLGNDSPTSGPDHLRGPSPSNGLSSLASTSTSDGGALQSNVRTATTSNSAQAFLLPGYTSQSDTSRSERFGDGGWIELTPRDAQLPQWRSPRVEDKDSTPERRLEEFADDAFWDDVLEGLEDLLDNSEDDTPSTNRPKPSRIVRNEPERAEPIEPQTAYQAARYDEGGMIALGVEENDFVDAPSAMADVSTLDDAAPITMEAGVALFQAFEWGESADARGEAAATSAREAEPSDDSAEKPEKEPTEPVQQVAAGVGLAVLFSGPMLRRRSEKRQIRLRRTR